MVMAFWGDLTLSHYQFFVRGGGGEGSCWVWALGWRFGCRESLNP